jgi:hypothetical protein
MNFKRQLLRLALLFFFPIAALSWGEKLSLVLSADKGIYPQEEEIFFSLTFRNISEEAYCLDMEYLQPREKMNIFTGGEFRLEVESSEGKLGFFTNHMPPEPRPGRFDVHLGPGEDITWKIFFPHYYYPFEIPNTFKVKASYKDFVSNEVIVRVERSAGMTLGRGIVNPGFSSGETFPYGWKLLNGMTSWDKEAEKLVFNLDKKTAYGEGIWVYSLFYGIESPVELILDIKVRSEAPEVIVFVEGWGLAGGRRRRLERNELFVHPVNKMEGYTFRVVFKKPEVKWFRIKLYSYLRPGRVWFDSVGIELPGK